MKAQKLFVATAAMGDHTDILGAWETWKGMVAALEAATDASRLTHHTVNVEVVPLNRMTLGSDGYVAFLMLNKGKPAEVFFVNGHSAIEIAP